MTNLSIIWSYTIHFILYTLHEFIKIVFMCIKQFDLIPCKVQGKKDIQYYVIRNLNNTCFLQK